MNIGQRTNGRQIVGCNTQHRLELSARFFELPQLNQRTTERHLCGQIPRMSAEAITADLDCLLVITCTPVLFGELRERNGAGVLLDPTAERLDTRIVCHAPSSECRIQNGKCKCCVVVRILNFAFELKRRSRADSGVFTARETIYGITMVCVSVAVTPRLSVIRKVARYVPLAP
jgi:hypothetical protein